MLRCNEAENAMAERAEIGERARGEDVSVDGRL
jgi:hypothetical protein